MDSVVPRQIYEETILDFFAPVRLYLDDPSVTEIMINGHSEIFIERGGRIERTDARFGSRHELMSAVRNMAQYVGRHADEQRPILEGRFPDGSRVEAILPPASPDGPTVSIRRFSRDPLTIDMLLGFGALTEDLAETLRVIVACKQNIIVAGGTASGKTSMLNALSSFIDPAERVVVIEDARELRLQLPHVVHLESQPPDARGRGQVSIRDLFRATLRVRPDRIVVGEVRGAESLDLIQAMTSGHGGCLSTVHATHPLDTLNRLETTALMSDVQLPLYALRSQVASAIDFVLHTSRLGDGSRCVTQLSEVVGYDPTTGYDFRDIFRREYHGRNADGRIRSTLAPTGKLPQCIDLIRGLGLELPAAVLAAARAAGPGKNGEE